MTGRLGPTWKRYRQLSGRSQALIAESSPHDSARASRHPAIPPSTSPHAIQTMGELPAASIPLADLARRLGVAQPYIVV